MSISRKRAKNRVFLLTAPWSILVWEPVPTDALAKAGLTTVGHILDKLAVGEQSLLDVEGFGRKSLIDLKKKLRSLGYDLPAAADEIVV